ncbi:MAG TPA: hypothetical protein VGD08_27175 [Stellaceae bacterium]|jgi:hypothetical protein
MRGIHAAWVLSAAMGVALIGGCNSRTTPDDTATVAPTSGAPAAASDFNSQGGATDAVTSGSASNGASGSQIYNQQQPGALRR